MSKAMSQQSTAWAVETVHAPFLPVTREALTGGEGVHATGNTDVRFLAPALCQRVFTAAGEVEAAEWALDRTVADAAASEYEIGVGLDVEPVDVALESARWALDQAVHALHAEIAAAARHGVPVHLLAEASGLDAAQIGSLLHAGGAPQDDLAAVV